MKLADSTNANLLGAFRKATTHKVGIKDFYLDFLGPTLGNNRYVVDKIVDNTFLRTGLNSSRSLMSSMEEDMSTDQSTMKIDEDTPTLDLISTYINGLNLNKESNRMRLLTLFSIFLVRDLRHKFYLLNIRNKKYANILESAYLGLYGSKFRILSECKDQIVRCVLGGEEYIAPPTDSSKIVSRYMQSHEVDSDDSDNIEDANDLTVHSEDPESIIKELGFKLLLNRPERTAWSDTFSMLSKSQKTLLHQILKDYRSLYIKTNQGINITLVNELLGVSKSTVQKYKSKVAEELISLSNKTTFIEVTTYLLGDDK